jgi:hypothetical protein
MSSTNKHPTHGRLAELDRAYRILCRRVARAGYVIKGTVTVQRLTCGQPTCRCHKSARWRHGPYYYWTTKVAGKTVGWVLSQEEGRLYIAWARNRQRLDRLIERMYDVSGKVATMRLGKKPPWLRRR